MKIEYINSSAKKALLGLPKEIQIQIQFLNDLHRVPNGKRPLSDFKHLEGIGSGVIELIENSTQAYRAVYCAKYLDTVFILHAFTKTTNGVDCKAMATVVQRYKALMAKTWQVPRR
ncbi:type II toxin-antitoxin system RelE/ParE family toxin [Rhizobium sp. FY34]|uniref:type II toxin-antitoxin system RelE/ParE family toxin n=1 Tax=Rhizobium sp. FY34 TaxID=2562309 RepID=UPI0010C13140|nr:type II toxin-antitoxin system RelE/ParE family toxin [Rhizobium sp. FY34]